MFFCTFDYFQQVQNALSYLASSSKIYVIASIDHINAPVGE